MKAVKEVEEKKEEVVRSCRLAEEDDTRGGSDEEMEIKGGQGQVERHERRRSRQEWKTWLDETDGPLRCSS